MVNSWMRNISILTLIATPANLLRKQRMLSPLYSAGIAVTLITSIPSLTIASNTAVNGIAARGQSMQAFTAVADDSSAVFYNPAGLTYLEGTEIYNTIIIMSPILTYKNSNNDQTTKSRQVIPGGSLFINTDKFKKFALGFGIYSPFAHSTEYKSNSAVYQYQQSATLLRLDAVPTIAYQLTPEVSIGAGMVGSRVTLDTKVLGLKQNSVGYGYTAQGGIMVKLPKKINFGLTYRGSESVKMDGTGTLAGMKDDFNSHLNFPAIASFGAAWQMNEKLLLSFAYDYEMWSDLKKVNNEYSNPILNSLGSATVDGTDQGTYRLGVLYRIKENDELHAGYSYAPRAIPKNNIIPAMPDYNTNFFSIGASHFYENWRFDIAYEYQRGEKFTNNSPLFPGTYSAHNNVLLLGITYTFLTQTKVE